MLMADSRNVIYVVQHLMLLVCLVVISMGWLQKSGTAASMQTLFNQIVVQIHLFERNWLIKSLS